MLDIRHRILQGSSAYLSTSEFIVVFLSNMTFRMSPMALAAGGRDGCGYDEICVKRLGRTPRSIWREGRLAFALCLAFGLLLLFCTLHDWRVKRGQDAMGGFPLLEERPQEA